MWEMTDLEMRLRTPKHSLPTEQWSYAYAGWNILGLVADRSACGYYRIINPLHMLKLHGANVHYDSQINLMDAMRYDVIVAPRQHNEEVHEILRQASWKGHLVVSEIDDDMDNIMPSSPAFPIYHQGTDELRNLNKIMRRCHGLTTTTVELGKWYLQNCQNVAIIDNYIDFSLRDWSCDVTWNGVQATLTPRPIPRPEKWKDKVVVMYQGGSCYDDQTEVLTENGFKLFKDLVDGEKVATLNPDTGELEYQLPTDYVVQDYTGDIYLFDTPYLDCAVTGNHWMYVAKRKSRTTKTFTYEKIQAENLWGQEFNVKKDAKWIGTPETTYRAETPGVKYRYERHSTPIEFQMNDWLQFFGYWVSEGYTSTSQPHVGLIQKKDNNMLKWVEDFCKKYSLSCSYCHGETELRIFDVRLYRHLQLFGKSFDKSIPNQLLNLPSDQLNILYDAMMLGDGSIDESGRSTYYTVSQRLADQMVEICLKTGRAANVVDRGIRESRTSDGRIIKGVYNALEVKIYRPTKKSLLSPSVRLNQQKKNAYNGKVYCVIVPNHLLYVRRNGKSMWCGNTHEEDFDLIGPEINGLLKKHPNMIFALYTSPELVKKFMEKFKFPHDRIDLVDPRHFLDHPVGLQGADIHLAPVKPTQFNLAKSALKIKETMAAGGACICSCIGPYARFHHENPNSVILVGQNNHSAPNFSTAINYLIENPKVLQGMKDQGRRLVMEKHSLEGNFHLWPKAWTEIAASVKAGVVGPPEDPKPKKWYRSYGSVDRNDPCPIDPSKKYKDSYYGCYG